MAKDRSTDAQRKAAILRDLSRLETRQRMPLVATHIRGDLQRLVRPPSLSGKLITLGVAAFLLPDPISDVPGAALILLGKLLENRMAPLRLKDVAHDARRTLQELAAISKGLR